MSKTHRLALDTLTFDPQCWPRLMRDDARVQQLADILRAGQQLPPIKVQKGTTLVLGGWHTAAACRLVGEANYFVEFVDVPADERLLFAYREDVAAALSYSDADVKSVARRLYEQRSCVNGELPNVAELARDLGRLQQTVARWVDDLVVKKQAAIELKRNARIVAVQALSSTGLSRRRIASLLGISHTQVATDTQMSIALHLTDSRIVTEAHSLIHMSLGQGATQTEMEAARDWLFAQTDPDYLQQRERQERLTRLRAELQDVNERWQSFAMPDSWRGCDATRRDLLQEITSLEGHLEQLKARLQ